MLTYHLVPRAEFDPEAPQWVPAAYARDGFIHTTRVLALIPEVANRYYRTDPRPYLLLTIDLERLAVPWRYDAAGEEYPHLYGPLNRAAIVGVRPSPRAPDGTFLSPVAKILYIAAKAPRPGLTKTRLGQAIGHEPAVALYRAFLQDLAARFASAPFVLCWFITPPDAWPEIAPLVAPTGEARVLAQGEGDWTERQRVLFREAAARGEERVILIASDSPHLAVETVTDAFRELDRHDLVVGPVYDGGYYLFGMRGWHDVLHGVPMSTGTVVQEIIARAERSGLSVGQVETTFDIDEADDLRYLQQLAPSRADLPATRAVLETLVSLSHSRSPQPRRQTANGERQ